MRLPLFDSPVELSIGHACSECGADGPVHGDGCCYVLAPASIERRTLPERLRTAAAHWEFVGPLLREAAAAIEQAAVGGDVGARRFEPGLPGEMRARATVCRAAGDVLSADLLEAGAAEVAAVQRGASS